MDYILLKLQNKFVSFDGKGDNVLRLLSLSINASSKKLTYYRDGGDWSIEAKIINGKLIVVDNDLRNTISQM